NRARRFSGDEGDVSTCFVPLDLLDRMDKREATVLRMRFGLDDQEPRTLQEPLPLAVPTPVDYAGVFVADPPATGAAREPLAAFPLRGRPAACTRPGRRG